VGPEMFWDDFRERYRVDHLQHRGERTAECAESRLDIAERILRPRRLKDFVSQAALHELQNRLLTGAESRFGRVRSPFTVRAYMGAYKAAINWAAMQGWCDSTPKLAVVKVSKLKHMKGRPLVAEEFERMLDVTPRVVGNAGAESWRFVLRGLWESALRIGELMSVSWDIPGTICPVWKRGRLPVLQIPAERQKNATEEAIPLLPWFEDLLNEVPHSERAGWVFEPASLQTSRKSPADYRPHAEWAAKIVSRIGKAAGIIVEPKDQTGRPAKFASSHDLRRSCAERLVEAGIPEGVITRVLRHASWETTRRHYAPGNVQRV